MSMPEIPNFVKVTKENIGALVSKNDVEILKKANKNFTPYHTSGDGNCLFNAVSLALYGNESNAAVLKKITAKYFAENYAELREEYEEMSLYFLDNYETLQSCLIDGHYSNPLTITAIANALGISIQLIYPPLNSNDVGKEILNTRIQPIEYAHVPKIINIMFTTCNKWVEGTAFVPNHYVALLLNREGNFSFF